MKNVYDNKTFFELYKNHRSESVNRNNLIENPIMKSLLPNLTDKCVLDLGCGDGKFDRFLIENGARCVVGVDISKNMIADAKKNNKERCFDYYVLDMEKLDTFEGEYDVIVSSLAFHYVKDFDKLLKDIYNLLTEDGILIFSQESPFKTAIIFDGKEQKNKIEIDGKIYYLLSDYQTEGERKVIWNKTEVTKYHRTYASLVNSLINNNFKIVKVLDSYASEEAIKENENYKKENDRPIFTFFIAKKNSLWGKYMFVEKIDEKDYEILAEKFNCYFSGMDKEIGINGERHVEFCQGSFSSASHIWFSDFNLRTSADIKNIETQLKKLWITRLSIKFRNEYVDAYKHYLKKTTKRDFGISL